MEAISSYRTKPVERYVQPVGGVILIAYALLMPAMSIEMKFFLIAIGAVAIFLGVLHHFHKTFVIHENFFEMKKTPMSPTHRFHYSHIEKWEDAEGSKLCLSYRSKNEVKKHTLHTGMLSKGDRERLLNDLKSLASLPAQDT
ncbi:MAG: hypothetical protein ACXIU5_14630 [Halomonadaceae bacterium]|jgi:hypothetical protein